MRFQQKLKLLILLVALVVAAAFVASCRGSKANVRKDENANKQPAAVEGVTTAAAIKRELPRFFEATGSLAGDQQTDVAPQTSGKVVAIGVDIGSYVKRGQMLVQLDESELKLRVDQAVAQVEIGPHDALGLFVEPIKFTSGGIRARGTMNTKHRAE